MSFSELPWHKAAYLHERPPSPTKGDPRPWSDTLGPGEALESAVRALGLTYDGFLGRLGPQCRQDWPTPTPEWVRAVDRRAAWARRTRRRRRIRISPATTRWRSCARSPPWSAAAGANSAPGSRRAPRGRG